MFYVAEGEVELMLGDEKVNASQGAFMLVPEYTPHAFSNVSRSHSTLLIMFCPADSREGYFEGMAELTKDGRQPSNEELVELMARYDQYLVPDPTSHGSS